MKGLWTIAIFGWNTNFYAINDTQLNKCIVA